MQRKSEKLARVETSEPLQKGLQRDIIARRNLLEPVTDRTLQSARAVNLPFDVDERGNHQRARRSVKKTEVVWVIYFVDRYHDLMSTKASEWDRTEGHDLVEISCADRFR